MSTTTRTPVRKPARQELDRLIDEITPADAYDILKRLAFILGYREVRAIVNDVQEKKESLEGTRWTLTERGRQLAVVG